MGKSSCEWKIAKLKLITIKSYRLRKTTKLVINAHTKHQRRAGNIDFMRAHHANPFEYSLVMIDTVVVIVVASAGLFSSKGV